MRMPSSRSGSPGMTISRTRRRTHCASTSPHAIPAPNKAPARRPRAAAPESAPPCTRRRTEAKLAPTSDLEPLERRAGVDDVALELELRLLEPGRDADQLRQMQDRQAELPP